MMMDAINDIFGDYYEYDHNVSGMIARSCFKSTVQASFPLL